MKFINNYPVKNNYNVIRLTVYENNINAIKLYEKNGFEKIMEQMVLFCYFFRLLKLELNTENNSLVKQIVIMVKFL